MNDDNGAESDDADDESDDGDFWFNDLFRGIGATKVVQDLPKINASLYESSHYQVGASNSGKDALL